MPHRSLKAVTIVSLAALMLFAPAHAQADAPAQSEAIEIPFEKFVLDNGLTLIVHEDHKAPIIAVNIWYHVGSKNERPGKTGFAHLFEHLMFNGSENYDDDYFRVLERLGATDLNGTTNNDRTNYFQNIPTSALDAVLWMESDRMGHLLGAIDQAKLDEQRGVVQNEKRQGENQPYGRVFNMIAENTFPVGHPYSWPVIGSMEDLDAASLEDVQDWFRSYYGPNNAVIVLAGDIDAETARQKVERYFGWIPPGPPVAAHDVWIPKMDGERRQVMQDRVPQARIYKVWNAPQWGSADGDYLGIVADVLANDGKSSRLYKRLDMNMLDEGTETRDALEISDELELLGANLGTGSNLDVSFVLLAALKANLDESLALFADVILNPSFPEADVERLKRQQLAGIQREKATPFQMALRAFPLLIYGDDHAYGIPFTGSGTEASVESLTRDDLAAFHETWFKPNNAKLVVVGDVTLDELRPELEQLFDDWEAGDVPAKNIAAVEQPPSRSCRNTWCGSWSATARRSRNPSAPSGSAKSSSSTRTRIPWPRTRRAGRVRAASGKLVRRSSRWPRGSLTPDRDPEPWPACSRSIRRQLQCRVGRQALAAHIRSTSSPRRGAAIRARRRPLSRR